MQKRSVRRKSLVLSLVFAAVAASGLFSTATNATLDPKTLPLVQSGDISYLGGFRLPRQTVNGTSYSFGGKALAFNAASNSLYVGSRNSHVAEVTIPTPLNSADANALPFASFLQPFADPTEGRLYEVGPVGVSLQSLMVYNNRLYGNASVYYDAQNEQRISHFSHSLQLNELSFSGWTRVWDAGKSGYVSGFMSPVPSEWQPLVGGAAVTGQCCIPIVTRTSMGPAAFAFNPSQIGEASTAATPLLYYTKEHPTLGEWAASNPTYGSSTEMGGMQIIPGTRTALYFGRNGMGPNCYGNGTSNPALAFTPDPEGGVFCYDPTNSSKGTHGYPYRYQMWAYDLNELAAVKAGTKQPWDVTPYGVWELNLPTPEPSTNLGGVAYDAERQILYVSQMSADRDGYEYRAVIHALKLTMEHIAEDTPPAVPPSATVSAVTLVANKTAPQAANTPVTFTATPAGGVGPHQYKWQVNDGNGWVPVSDWTTSSQFVWTPTTANQNYFVGLAVRSNGNTADAAEATASTPFPISAPVILRVSAVTLVADKTAPQPTNVPVTFTATPTGGSAPHQYQWLVNDGNGWAPAGTWTTSRQFVWTPTVANAGYFVAVRVRSAGNTADAEEASASTPFGITAAIAAEANPVPTTTANSRTVSSVTLVADKTAPQAANVPVTFTATPSGGSAPHQYQWLVNDGNGWAPAGTWTTSNQFVWTPATAKDYFVGVRVRSAGNTSDVEEASASTPFAISAPAPTPAPAPVSATVTAVTLVADKTAPQPTNVPVTFTATPSGGSAPHQYQWLVNDGNGWVPVGTWTTSSQFVWTPATAKEYFVGVRVRSAGSTAAEEASASTPFAISASVSPAPAPVSATVTAVTLVADKTAPQAVNVPVTFTATPTGGIAPHQYEWLVNDGNGWVPVGAWTTSRQFVWTPATAREYFVGVRVRSAGSTAAEEASASTPFAIK